MKCCPLAACLKNRAVLLTGIVLVPFALIVGAALRVERHGKDPSAGTRGGRSLTAASAPSGGEQGADFAPSGEGSCQKFHASVQSRAAEATRSETCRENAARACPAEPLPSRREEPSSYVP